MTVAAVDMSEQAESAFVQNLFGAIKNQPVTYPDDYQTTPENSLKRIPILPVSLANLNLYYST